MLYSALTAAGAMPRSDYSSPYENGGSKRAVPSESPSSSRSRSLPSYASVFPSCRFLLKDRSPATDYSDACLDDVTMQHKSNNSYYSSSAGSLTARILYEAVVPATTSQGAPYGCTFMSHGTAGIVLMNHVTRCAAPLRVLGTEYCAGEGIVSAGGGAATRCERSMTKSVCSSNKKEMPVTFSTKLIPFKNDTEQINEEGVLSWEESTTPFVSSSAIIQAASAATGKYDPLVNVRAGDEVQASSMMAQHTQHYGEHNTNSPLTERFSSNDDEERELATRHRMASPREQPNHINSDVSSSAPKDERLNRRRRRQPALFGSSSDDEDDSSDDGGRRRFGGHRMELRQTRFPSKANSVEDDGSFPSLQQPTILPPCDANQVGHQVNSGEHRFVVKQSPPAVHEIPHEGVLGGVLSSPSLTSAHQTASVSTPPPPAAAVVAPLAQPSITPASPSISSSRGTTLDPTQLQLPQELAAKKPRCYVYCRRCNLTFPPHPASVKAHLKLQHSQPERLQSSVGATNAHATTPLRNQFSAAAVAVMPEYLEPRTGVTDGEQRVVSQDGPASSSMFFELFDLVQLYCNVCDVAIPPHNFKAHGVVPSHVQRVKQKQEDRDRQ